MLYFFNLDFGAVFNGVVFNGVVFQQCFGSVSAFSYNI